jgi:hypothetical protein
MFNRQLAFDAKAFGAAIIAGQGPELIRQLAEEKGIIFDASLGEMRWLKPGVNLKHFERAMAAMDAQSELVTVSNAGIPSYLANFLDPKVINVLVSPMVANEIAPDVQKGTWVTETAQFITVEAGGKTAAYGDYSNSGYTTVNANFPSRQNFVFQAFLQYGQRELEIAGLAKLDWATQQQNANALALMKQLNDIYFYGVANLENYGLLNDPTLPPALTPQFSWLTSASATAYTIYQDVVRMFIQLQAQSNGVIREDVPMTLAMSPVQRGALKQITQYNTNSVEVLLKENFPNLRIVTAVQYATAQGQLMQLICDELGGQKTVETAFSSRMMAHNMVVESSSWKQKRSSAGYGAIWYRPFLCVQMLG